MSASLDDNNKEASTTALPAATRTAPPKVEPHGAEVLREIIARRRRDKSVRQRQDRIRRQAYQQVRPSVRCGDCLSSANTDGRFGCACGTQALDIKVFEAEVRLCLTIG